MSRSIPILSVNMDWLREDSKMVFDGKINLKNVFERDGEYYIDTLVGRAKLNDKCKIDYLNYLKCLEQYKDVECEYDDTYCHLIKGWIRYGLSVPASFTGHEMLYFDMTVEL